MKKFRISFLLREYVLAKNADEAKTLAKQKGFAWWEIVEVKG
nr:MAG TPA: hypothetical protein [Caudoviricetes sp.]